MEKLIVKNFGPIKDATVVVRDLNVFIGETSSGKSTLAKLIAIFNSVATVSHFTRSTFDAQLDQYSLRAYWQQQSDIEYQCNCFSWRITHAVCTTDYPFGQTITDALFTDNNAQNAATAKGLHPLNIPFITDQLAKHGPLKLEGSAANRLQKLNRLIYKARVALLEYEKQQHTPSRRDSWVAYKAAATAMQTELTTFLPIHEPIYVPAERALLVMAGASAFGLMSGNIALPPAFVRFGAMYELAKSAINKHAIPFLDATVSHETNGSFVQNASASNGYRLQLAKASSGLQSSVPLLTLIEAIVPQPTQQYCVAVEEPELNLYPLAQKQLIQHLLQHTLQAAHKVLLTTHSPYILTSINNLLEAHNAFTTKPEKAAEIEKIIPKAAWLDANRVSAYYLKNGKVKNLLDRKERLIKESGIDDASDVIGNEFQALLNIQFGNA